MEDGPSTERHSYFVHVNLSLWATFTILVFRFICVHPALESYQLLILSLNILDRSRVALEELMSRQEKVKQVTWTVY